MKKIKSTTSFVCQECGYDTPSWFGKCPECGTWNSLKEIRNVSAPVETSNGITLGSSTVKAQTLKEIVYSKTLRIQTEYEELNTVLGGGIVQGGALLMAGDPGVGKSTLLLQLCLSLAREGKKVLYVSGEESVEQIKMRALRIDAKQPQKKGPIATQENLLLISLTNTDLIVKQIEEIKPELVIIDSIQTIESQNVSGLSGSVGQVRYGALQFVRIAKQTNIPVVIVGHVTKEGMVAGPMVLSHMVDTVLFWKEKNLPRREFCEVSKIGLGRLMKLESF